MLSTLYVFPVQASVALPGAPAHALRPEAHVVLALVTDITSNLWRLHPWRRLRLLLADGQLLLLRETEEELGNTLPEVWLSCSEFVLEAGLAYRAGREPVRDGDSARACAWRPAWQSHHCWGDRSDISTERGSR